MEYVSEKLRSLSNLKLKPALYILGEEMESEDEEEHPSMQVTPSAQENGCKDKSNKYCQLESEFCPSSPIVRMICPATCNSCIEIDL